MKRRFGKARRGRRTFKRGKIRGKRLRSVRVARGGYRI